MFTKPKFIIYSDAVNINSTPEVQEPKKDEEIQDESNKSTVSEANEEN